MDVSSVLRLRVRFPESSNPLLATLICFIIFCAGVIFAYQRSTLQLRGRFAENLWTSTTCYDDYLWLQAGRDTHTVNAPLAAYGGQLSCTHCVASRLAGAVAPSTC